jgi:hypothetical protein
VTVSEEITRVEERVRKDRKFAKDLKLLTEDLVKVKCGEEENTE